MSNRPNALLTSAQRANLLSEGDDDHSRQYRQRIRERTREGTRDLGILFEHLESRDIQRIFADGDKIEQLHEVLDILDDIRSRLKNPGRLLNEYIGELEPLVLDRGYSEEEWFATLETVDDETRVPTEIVELHVDTLNYIDQTADELATAIADAIAEIEMVDDKLNRLLNSSALPSEYQEEIAAIIEDLDERIRQAQTSRDTAIDSIEKITDKYSTLSQAGRDSPSKIADELTTKDRAPELRSSELSDTLLSNLYDIAYEWGLIRHKLSLLHRRIRTASRQRGIDRSLRDDVVSAVAFYLRVCETVGASSETLLEEALVRAHEQEHPDDVVGHASVTVETADRQEASSHGIEKLREGTTRLTSTELRGVAETAPQLLLELQEPREITKVGLREVVLSDLERVQEGLGLVVAEPTAPGDAIVPDIVAADEDHIVLIELMRADHLLEAVDATVDRLHQLIDEYGGPEKARALVVVPNVDRVLIKKSAETLQSLHADRSIDLTSVEVSDSPH